MRTNRSWTIKAVAGLAGIVFLWGCGSQRAEAPPPTAAQSQEQSAPAPEVAQPVPESASETRPESAAQTKPKSAKPKFLMKREAPKAAKPAEMPNIISSSPEKTEEILNPVRGPRAASVPEMNPMRTENPPEIQRYSESSPRSPDDSDLSTAKKLFMREAEETVEAKKSEINDSMRAAPEETEYGGGPAMAAPDEADDSMEPPPEILEYREDPAMAAPAMAEDSEKPPPAESEYTVVKVFYGTDRASLNAEKISQSSYSIWLTRTIVAATATLILSILGFRFIPSRVIRGLAYTGMFATGAFAGLAIHARFQSILSGDSAKASLSAFVSYGADRGKLELGSCDVSIPKSHEVGALESPSVLRLEFRENRSRHVMLLGIHPEPAERFFADLRECVGRSSHKSAFVFVHGYNTNFNDAARRTAQIAYDLKFDGAPIFFSWPSQGGLLQYAVDETNVTWTTPHLLRFLTDVAERSGAERIHLVAHSMGNRALTAALRDLSLMQKTSEPLFNEVVLTAPDIDAEVFINDIAPAIVKTAKRVTLYASSNDEALIMSKTVHGYPRAGDSGGQLIVVPGMDTVDVSAVDTSLVGHNYYGDNTSVLADIFELINASKPADQRRWLRAERLGLLKYWVFHQ